MIDHFAIFLNSGVGLWSWNSEERLKGRPVANLVRTVLMEGKSSESQWDNDVYSLQWTFANELDLVFVVVYQKMIMLSYAKDLLASVKQQFVASFGSNIKNYANQEFDFGTNFSSILKDLEEKEIFEKESKKSKVPRKFEQTETGKKLVQDKAMIKKEDEPAPKSPQLTPVKTPQPTTPSKSNSTQQSADEVKKNIENLNKKLNAPKPFSKKGQTTTTTAPPPPKGKTARTWDDIGSIKPPTSNVNLAQQEVETLKEQEEIRIDDWSDMAPQETQDDQEEEEVEEEEDVPKKPQLGMKQQQTTTTTTSSSGGMWGYLRNLAGTKSLDAADLQPVLLKFKDHLISKNVASEVAEKLCDSVRTSLEGKQTGTFSTIRATVKTALEEALVRILTPKRNIDVIRDVMTAKQEGRPYVICFCGVNGVGKSTNLAKVASWIIQNNFTVMMAACDTFRSGAVEQLGVHAKRLGVDLYQKGYAKDPTIVAQEAIAYAKQQKRDVVLIDTAGRMEDNAPLMMALSKLVNTVQPDLVLFVGEAIVGNGGVHQLIGFDKALTDLSKDETPRLVDGIILTKFDTIDDKVGAAISMVFATGHPILFLGTGQSYRDLKRLNVQVVTQALLRGA